MTAVNLLTKWLGKRPLQFTALITDKSDVISLNGSQRELSSLTLCALEREAIDHEFGYLIKGVRNTKTVRIASAISVPMIIAIIVLLFRMLS